MRIIHRTVFSILIASTVLLPNASIFQTETVSAAANPVTVNNISAIKLEGGSTAQITDLQFLYGNGEKTVYFTVTVYNNSKSDLNFADYWVELWTKSGSKYSIKMNEQDAKNTKVVSKTSTDFRFTAKVNASVNLADFKFKLIKWDFSQANYTRTVGETSVPYGYNAVVPATTGQTVKINGLKMSTILTKSQFVSLNGVLEGTLIYRITNYSGRSIPLNNLNFYIKRSGGTLSKLNVEAATTQQLAPGATQEIQLYGTLPTTKIDTNMQLVVTGLNDDTKSEVPVGSYEIKAISLDQAYVKPGQVGKLIVEGNSVNTKIRDIYYNPDGDNQVLSMYLNFNNIGKSSVNLSNYNYYIMTNDGALYPSKQTQATTLELSPDIEKDQYLQFNLPSNAKTDSLKLIIRKTSEDNKKGYAVGLFQVPPKPVESGSNGKAVKYTTKQGLFEFNVLHGERLPWGEQDLINAVISVRNTQLSTKSLPNLKVAIQINGYTVDDKNIQLIKTDQNVSISGGGYTLYIVSTKIPYTYTSNKVSVILYEAGGGADGAALTTIGTFPISSSNMQLPIVRSVESMDVSGIGRTANLQIKKIQTYTNTISKTKLLYAEFDYKSLEQRFSNLPNLQAYIKTKDGNFVPANFQNIKDKVSPNKTSLVVAYASFPLDYDLTEAELWIGQGITQGQFTAPDGTADGYVNAVNYQMPQELSDVQTTFENLVINPYKITMKKFSPSLQDAYKINIDFEYDLSKITDYEKTIGTHKLTLELVDRDNKFVQSLDLENGNGALKVGESEKATVSFEDQKLWGIIYREFTLNVYDEFQGYKKLLATQKINAALTNL